MQAIICDVGGVLIRTRDRRLRRHWAAELGITPATLEELIFSGISGDEAQLGQRSSRAHWRWLGEHLALSPSERDRLVADFFSGDVLNEELMATLRGFQQRGVKLGLLSNYFDEARTRWEDRFGLPSQFDVVVISGEVKMVKPTPEIYRLTLNELGVTSNQSLFIDDSEVNIRGAEALGIPSLLFRDNETAIDELQRRLHGTTG
ncbi:MAG: HAD family phosphatase [Myxococcales bacterium]|nr:HAD family phosphatase [Myxococcales bacterium]